MEKEREKHWMMTQERAKQLYELIQQSLDPHSWEVYINSKRKKMTLTEFKRGAEESLSYGLGLGGYSPTTLARDCLCILDSLFPLFDNMRNRLEDSFKGILIANESMNSYFEKLTADMENTQQAHITHEQKIKALQAENEMLKKSLEIKSKGIEPLKEVYEVYTKQIFEKIADIKRVIGDEDEMKKFLPLINKDFDMMRKFWDDKATTLFSMPTVPTSVVIESQAEIQNVAVATPKKSSVIKPNPKERLFGDVPEESFEENPEEGDSQETGQGNFDM